MVLSRDPTIDFLCVAAGIRMKNKLEFGEDEKLQNSFSFDNLVLNMLVTHSALLIAFHSDNLLRYDC